MTEPLGRVAVFWHYDSLPPPGIGGSPRTISRTTYDSLFNIRQALYKFGIITCFRAYVGSMPLQAKWELQSHGVTVIECLWNASETMITADMFSFALDNPSLGSTLVLISSSFTLAYTISVLGARRYRVALISIPDPNNDILLAQASEVIDWRFLRPQGNVNRSLPAPSPPAMQNSSDRSSPEHPTSVEYGPHPGPANFPRNTLETLEHSFTINDLNLPGNREGGPTVHPNAAQLEPQQPPPVDNRPPSRQIEEAILNHPVFEDEGEHSGPHSPDPNGRHTSVFARSFNRSVSELALCGNIGTARPRSNSLQDDRCLKSPSHEPTLRDHIAMRSLPIPRGTPLSFGGLASGNPLNVGASPFIPSPVMMTPPNEPSEDAATTISPPSPGPSLTTKLTRETGSPSLRLERVDSALSASSCSTPSTVKPDVEQANLTKKPRQPTKPEFTKGERRAVETVINVLLERKGKGQARVNPKHLPNLILAKDKTIYRSVGNRGNRFWKLINLGIQMGWLEVGPENTWIDVGKGWTEEGLT